MTSIAKILPIISLAWFFAGGCTAPAPGAGRFPDQETWAPDLSREDVPAQDQSLKQGVFEPTGTWAALAVISVCEMTLGRVVEVNNYSLYLVDLDSPDGWRITEHRTKCLMAQTPILGVRTVYPKGLVVSLNPTSVQGITDSHETGAEYVEEPYAEVWGTKLDDPMEDTLPTTLDDPRVIDSDHDGHPGATMILGQICQVFVTQRTTCRWECRVAAPDRIECKGPTHVELNRLDATDPFCLSKDHLMDNSNYSYLVFRRIDGMDGSVNLDLNKDGKIDCSELNSQWKPLFPNPDSADDSHCDWVGHKK